MRQRNKYKLGITVHTVPQGLAMTSPKTHPLALPGTQGHSHLATQSGIHFLPSLAGVVRNVFYDHNLILKSMHELMCYHQIHCHGTMRGADGGSQVSHDLSDNGLELEASLWTHG